MQYVFKFTMTLVSIAVSAGIGWSVWQYSAEIAGEAPPTPAKKPLAVEVTQLQQQTVFDRVELVGSLEAAAETQIRARTPGYITKLPFDVGDFVEKDRVVVEIDKLKAMEAKSQADAALKVAQARLKGSLSRQKEIKTRLERYESLLKSKATTAQLVNEIRTELAVADADVELNQALVDQANSAIVTSQLTLRETEIKTSVEGYVAERFAEVGDLADSNAPILRIVDLKKVHTIVHVVEKDYSKIHLGQTAKIEVDAYPGKTFTGNVIRVAPLINIETRTAAVELEIKNQEGYLKPGMYARVELQFDERLNTDVAPLATLQEDETGQFVLVVDPENSKVVRKPLEVGITDGAYVEILSGLDPTDRIITLGGRLVSVGDVVEVKDREPSPQANDTSTVSAAE